MDDKNPPLDLAGVTPERLRTARVEFERFLMAYEAGIDEIETKVRILQREFSHAHDYNPIEHISSRLKSVDSLARKAKQRGCTDLGAIREQITDIAGVRVVCSFASDVYRIQDILCSQSDVTVLQIKDYVGTPKANGYRSLHMIVKIPVFLSAQVELVTVEVQIRTIAMDFWASLEHKIYYKYDGDIPRELLDGLSAAAATSAKLDDDMERLHDEVQELRHAAGPDEDLVTVELIRTLAEINLTGE